MLSPRNIAILAGAGLLLGACSSSSSGHSSSTSAPSDNAAPVTSASPAAPASEAAGMPLLASGPVPAVGGATDMSKEPTISAGTPPAPTNPTGKDLVVGHGPVAGPDATVKVQYVGALFDTGKVFDASWTDGNGPATFPLSGVIPGFKDAIVGMAVGGRREVVIPPAEGYGASGSPPAIPGNATLVFVIDLLSVQ